MVKVQRLFAKTNLKIPVYQAEFAVCGDAFLRKMCYSFLRRNKKCIRQKLKNSLPPCEKNGMMQEQLGEKLGVTSKTVSRWENGSDMPDFEA